MAKSKEISNGANYTKVLNINNINPAVVAAKYAVRGELALRANVLTEQLKHGGTDLPFDDVVHCEIGNPQALNQKPLSFIRQVRLLVYISKFRFFH
jgi:alanine transaminase